jgi:chemotaxis protein methyltransferase CheR
MGVPLTDDEYRLFSEWLAAEVGIRFGPERREILRARLEPLRVELDLPSFEQLLFRVRYHPDRTEALTRMITQITNNESYFFRESRQLDLLRHEVLPEMGRAARAHARPVRILSAGCAAGEEAYTLAIIAGETLGSPAKAAITGVDIDSAALQRAEEGLYRDHALRGLDLEIRAKYFRNDDGRWRVRAPFRAAARFRHANLVDPRFASDLEPQDVVFCRNVLIYFGDAAIRLAVDHLYQVVRPGGCLFLGHAESLSRVPTRFVAERRPGAVFYRRPVE